MYPRKRRLAFFVNIDDLGRHNEDRISKEVEDGVLKPEEGGFLRGNMMGSNYLSEEEEE